MTVSCHFGGEAVRIDDTLRADGTTPPCGVPPPPPPHAANRATATTLAALGRRRILREIMRISLFNSGCVATQLSCSGVTRSSRRTRLSIAKSVRQEASSTESLLL